MELLSYHDFKILKLDKTKINKKILVILDSNINEDEYSYDDIILMIYSYVCNYKYVVLYQFGNNTYEFLNEFNVLDIMSNWKKTKKNKAKIINWKSVEDKFSNYDIITGFSKLNIPKSVTIPYLLNTEIKFINGLYDGKDKVNCYNVINYVLFEGDQPIISINGDEISYTTRDATLDDFLNAVLDYVINGVYDHYETYLKIKDTLKKVKSNTPKYIYTHYIFRIRMLSIILENIIKKDKTSNIILKKMIDSIDESIKKNKVARYKVRIYEYVYQFYKNNKNNIEPNFLLHLFDDDMIDSSIQHFKVNNETWHDIINNIHEVDCIAISNEMNKYIVLSDDFNGIPLFINKYHWENAKKFIELRGYMHNNQENKCIEIFYTTYFKECIKILLENKISIDIFMSLFRTCAQINFDFKYSHGLEKHLNKIKDTKLQPYYLDIIIMQIITTGCVINKDDYINMIEKAEIKEIEIYEKIWKVYEVMQIMFKKCGSFNKFIKEIDNNYGYSKDINEQVKKLLT